MSIDLSKIQTPCYVCEEEKLQRNLEILDKIQQQAGCKIILALKSFAMFSVFPLMKKFLKGTTASSLNEAKLGYEEFGGEIHLYAPAYADREFEELAFYADHIVFNSFSQWHRFKDKLHQAKKPLQLGIRINPEYSAVKTLLYNPCVPYSRLGVTLDRFEGEKTDWINGLHFHTHCGNQAETLEQTLKVVERDFAWLLEQVDWINFGGGHLITDVNYDLEKLCQLIQQIKQKYQVDVYIEPGEAVVSNAGVLVSSVLDIFKNGMSIAVLDTSATAHMPDILEMPYRSDIVGAQRPGILPHTYRLTGNTCLSGDVIGDYSFQKPLEVGTKLIFGDMLQYTMVKNTMFNGMSLPSIAIWSEEKGLRMVKDFGYEYYKSRLS
ncbi:carboxynorspermidine decarboxylase [Deltaproteobacteria bacterium TL4]